jgi:hypothetical protein
MVMIVAHNCCALLRSDRLLLLLLLLLPISSNLGDFAETDLTGLKRIHMLARTGDLSSIEHILFGKDGMLDMRDIGSLTGCSCSLVHLIL